ncbi:MAG: dam [Bacteroidetes bacterium]|nr:dam [Bacteroidota bacterium]
MDIDIGVKPFVKWAGGKYRLYEQIRHKLPTELNEGAIKYYYEPFLGGGAMFFRLAQQYKFNSIFLSDLNEELVLTYKVVQYNVSDLLEYLWQYQKKYNSLSDKDKESYFYEMRASYNMQRFNVNFKKFSELYIPRAAQMIFLNKTCYNGLFRQNLKGEFNVPFGKNYNVQIVDSNNLCKISTILQNVEIRCEDFCSSCDDVKSNSFVYFDPPYSPVSKTANFTSYCKGNFYHKDQVRLSNLFRDLDKSGTKLMLSNSYVETNDIISELYKGYYFSYIYSHKTMPSIISKRGKVKELLITNY